jgi:ribulose bisphosphate carboxylase small subunit
MKNKITLQITLSITLNINLHDIVSPKEVVEQSIEQLETEGQLKHFVRDKAKFLIRLYNIDEHGNDMVLYFAGHEPNINNNRKAIETWVMTQLTLEGINVDEVDKEFTTLLSSIDPTVELCEF